MLIDASLSHTGTHTHALCPTCHPPPSCQLPPMDAVDELCLTPPRQAGDDVVTLLNPHPAPDTRSLLSLSRATGYRVTSAPDPTPSTGTVASPSGVAVPVSASAGVGANAGTGVGLGVSGGEGGAREEVARPRSTPSPHLEEVSESKFSVNGGVWVAPGNGPPVRTVSTPTFPLRCPGFSVTCSLYPIRRSAW